VQVGLSLIGVLAGAATGASLADNLTPHIAQIPGIQESADAIALVLVAATITMLSLVIGEPVPMRPGLTNSERIAIVLDPLSAKSPGSSTPLRIRSPGDRTSYQQNAGVRMVGRVKPGWHLSRRPVA
jgi:putative hemolysin